MPTVPNETIPRSIPYVETPISRFHALVGLAATGGQFSDGYVLGTIGIALSSARGPLHLDALMLGLLGGASLAGLFAGSLLLGPLADRFGRRPMLAPVMAMFAVCSLLQLFVASAWQLLSLRLILGLMLGIDYVVCSTVVAEFAPAKVRGRLLSLLVMFWSLGYTTAFIVGTVLSGRSPDAWRWILASSAIPSALIFFVRLKIPESPTWLVQTSRLNAARAIVDRHFGMDVDLPAVRRAEPQSLVRAWTELFSAKFRRRTLVGGVYYTAQVIPYFALGTFIPDVFRALGIRSTYAGGVVFNVFMLLGTGFGLWLIDKLTRRTFLVGSFYLSAAMLSVLVLFDTAPIVTVIAASLFAFILAAATNLDFAYLPELFPTRLRASGVGVGTAASRVGSAVSTFLLPVGLETIGIRATLGACVIVLIVGGLVCQAYAPETRGASIED